jgi:transcriptional regulator GlxA family with amidase domain
VAWTPASPTRAGRRPRTAIGASSGIRHPRGAATLLAEATLAIEARHDDPKLTLADVARDVSTSTRQLQRVFAEQAGGSFRDELIAVRMPHAAALLRTTDRAIAEIGRRVGYRQPAHFGKALRRHHGIPPSGLRRARSAGADAARAARTAARPG